MVAEEVLITLSGGAPWGFRLQGGVEHQKPLQVAKVRKRSKACRAGLQEADELLSINEEPCSGLSHAQAMILIDSSPGILHIRVKRSPAGFQSVVLLTRAPSPRIDKEYRAALRAMSPSASKQQPAVREVHQTSLTSPRARSGVTSPPGSEAYYGETDSDADVTTHERQRRQKRRSPSSGCPGKGAGRAAPEGGENSEMSGYDSAPDARPPPQGAAAAEGGGATRREGVYQLPGAGQWSSQTSTETSSVSADGQAEEDSGFQDLPAVPLVSPERAKEALMLGSRAQLVPMVGPVHRPVDEELTVTYMDKAKQAKLNRGDTAQDKQVKEARTKCRTIASLLTDAPNPHSKGVLMFKKRRQRSKKYTLTSFGSVEEDTRRDSQEEEEEEGGAFPGSESEFDEEGFAAAPDATWDGDYLEQLEKRAAASAGGRGGEEGGPEEAVSPGLSDTSGKGAQLFEQQRKRAAEHAKKVAAAQPKVQTPPQTQPYFQQAAEARPTLEYQAPSAPSQEKDLPLVSSPTLRMTNGVTVNAAGSVTNVVTSAPATLPKPPSSSIPLLATLTVPTLTTLPDLPSSSVLNRTARPFAPGVISSRTATAPVMFRPTVAKTQRPATAAAFASPPFSPPSVAPAFPLPLSAGGPASLPPESSGPFSPPYAANISSHLPNLSSSMVDVRAFSQVPVPPLVSNPAPPPAPSPSFVPRATAFQAGALRTERVAPPPGRTSFLLDARRRSAGRQMFKLPEEKKQSPNPDLLNLVQNLDERPRYGAAERAASEEDSFSPEPAELHSVPQRGRVPPPVAPKPRVLTEGPQILQTEGKGATLFARRQTRMDQFLVDAPEAPRHDDAQPASLPAQWKYSPNIRAPPPIGYNPLLSPSCPVGVQRGSTKPDRGGRGGPGVQKEGIKALDFMRRQPYQLNPAMFSFGGGASTQPAKASHQHRSQYGGYIQMGSSLTPPRQIPVKAARVYEIKRFSTPTPMSAPTLTPTVITPRSATSLGEPLCRSDTFSPPLDPQSSPFTSSALPELPKISAAPVPSRVPFQAPAPLPGLSYAGLQAAKQFQSAPELSALPLRAPPIQVPKPRFIANRLGSQPHVWRPGTMHH